MLRLRPLHPCESVKVCPHITLAVQHVYLRVILADPTTNLVNGVHPLALNAKMIDPDTLANHMAIACGD